MEQHAVPATPADLTSARPNRRFRRALGATGTALAVMAGTVVGLASPASATVAVATSGTTMTVTLTGTENVNVSCVGGVVSVNTKTGSPTIPCASLTKVTFNGDSGAQTINGQTLELGVFAAKPSLTASLGAGNDVLTETTRNDTIDMGAGDDNLYLVYGAVNANLDLGADKDTARLYSTAGAEEITGASTNANIQLIHEINGVQRATTVKNLEGIEVGTQGGDDIVDLSGITTGSTITTASIYGGDGNDTIRGAAKIATNLFGGTGDNKIYGGTGNDNIGSEGNGDVIDAGDGANWVSDRNSGRSGRTVANKGNGNRYITEMGQGDSVTRIRPGASNGAIVTNSLARPGQQVLGSTWTKLSSYNGSNTAVDGRGLFDVVALANSHEISIDGDAADNDLLDVTIPTGSWTVSVASGSGWITPSDASYKPIKVDDLGTVKVHGPWTNKNSGFVHRVTRDLAFRFATDPQIASTSVALGDGSTTRKAVVDGLMKTDEYRGLDVDRIFARYLRRAADPSGRAYWINATANGRALWRFRAQLFGSNEYFNKAGASNGAYLDKVYLDVLGRLPDPSGRAYWIGKLDAGADRGAVALKFINAAEFRRTTVDDQFLRFLDRKPTTSEQANWVDKLAKTTTGEQDLIATLANSDEYLNRN